MTIWNTLACTAIVLVLMLLDNRLLWLVFIVALALHPDEATAVAAFELYGSGFLSDDGVADVPTPSVEGSPA